MIAEGQTAAPADRHGQAYVGSVVGVLALAIGLTIFEQLVVGTPPTWAFWLQPEPSAVAGAVHAVGVAALAVLVTCVVVTGIAVPLTASLYTPRLLDQLVGDRTYRRFFCFLVVAVLLTHVAPYAIRDGQRFEPSFVPNTLAILAFLVGLSTVPALGAFLLHLCRFLAPRELVRRMTADVTDLLDQAVTADSDALRTRLNATISQFTEVAVRAASRHDAAMMTSVVDSFGIIADHYWRLKGQMPEDWFEGDPTTVTTAPKGLIKTLLAERTWFEFSLLRCLDDLLPQVLRDSPEATVRVARVLRRLAVGADAAGDAEVVGLCLKFLNSFLRLTLSQRHVRGFYYLSWQYLRLAEELAESPQPWVRQIAGHLAYYSREAATAGMPFASHVALYDLADVLVLARDAGLPAAEAIREDLLGLLRADDELPLEPAVKVLAHALSWDQGDLILPLEACLQAAEPARLRAAVQTVLSAEERYYREVTARFTDLNYVAKDDRAALRSWAAAFAEEPLA